MGTVFNSGQTAKIITSPRENYFNKVCLCSCERGQVRLEDKEEVCVTKSEVMFSGKLSMATSNTRAHKHTRAERRRSHSRPSFPFNMSVWTMIYGEKSTRKVAQFLGTSKQLHGSDKQRQRVRHATLAKRMFPDANLRRLAKALPTGDTRANRKKNTPASWGEFW